MPALLLLFGLSSSSPPGLSDAGVRAATERRFCDASAIFVQLHGATRDPLALYRAGETAFAAADYLAAVRLYRTLLDNHPAFERASIVNTRLQELQLIVRDKGPGTACALPPRICGDWIISAGEACDDGNLNDGDGCDGTCLPTGCGNGVLTAPEICDDANTNNGDGCDSNCSVSGCGNGAISTGEDCDDGNSVNGDGCDSTCTLSRCGNSIKAGNEDCDDGNVDGGDGCSSTCQIETPPAPFAWGVFGAGAGAVVVAAALVALGAQPFLAHSNARAEVIAAEDLGPVNPTLALSRARQAQAAQAQAQSDWTSWGLPLVGAGAALATAGVAVVVASFFVDLEPADPPPPDTDPSVGAP